jgi:hypothetical protein
MRLSTRSTPRASSNASRTGMHDSAAESNSNAHLRVKRRRERSMSRPNDMIFSSIPGREKSAMRERDIFAMAKMERATRLCRWRPRVSECPSSSNRFTPSACTNQWASFLWRRHSDSREHTAVKSGTSSKHGKMRQRYMSKKGKRIVAVLLVRSSSSDKKYRCFFFCFS